MEGVSLDQVRYSRVWEDHALLEAGLDVGAGDSALCITSGGDNVLALLLQEPASVTAVDVNPCQGALLALKVAGIRHLTYTEFTAFLGAAAPGCSPWGAGEREKCYARLRPHLAGSAREFWDSRAGDVAEGVLHCGRLERYFRTFQTRHLPALMSPATIARLLDFDGSDPAAQAAFVAEDVDTPSFRAAFRNYFGRESMARQGRDPAQFAHVEVADVGAAFYERFLAACLRPTRDNFYLEAFLTSACRDLSRGPLYLSPGGFARLGPLLDRLEIVTAGVEEVLTGRPPGTFTKAALSDALEYLDAAQAEGLLGLLAGRLRAGARVAYWSLLVDRSVPATLQDRISPDGETAARLHAHDRSWFYRSFHVSVLAGTGARPRML